jgi:enoyl-CoA hydratase
MPYETILYEKINRVGVVTLNRPGRLNAVNNTMLEELDDVLRVSETDIDVKVLLIKGAGRSFCSGADLSGGQSSELLFIEQGDLSAKEQMDTVTRWNMRWEALFNYTKPTVAQVHGHCLGAGCYLAMVCDITVASEDAVFGDPSIRLGQVTSSPLWTWMVGIKKAKEMIMLGRCITGKEAEQIGLANKAVPADKLEEETAKYVKALSISPGDGMVVCKESINGALEARGVGAAWRFMSEMHTISAFQQRHLGFNKGEYNFWKTRDRKGLKAAIKERDDRFKKFIESP